MSAPEGLRVTEFTDATCPWAWGSEPKFRWLRESVGPETPWRVVHGILFDVDDDEPPDEAAETRWYSGELARIAADTRAPVPEVLDHVARTSWPAALAATAAAAQGSAVAAAVLRRLRESTFVFGQPPDDVVSVMRAVHGVAGLDPRLLSERMHAAPTVQAVRADWEHTRHPDAELIDEDRTVRHPRAAKLVNGRYRFPLPTLVFEGPSGRSVVPGWRSIADYAAGVRAVTGADLTLVPRRPTAEALRHWGTLTDAEVELLCTGPVPTDAVSVRVRTGALHLSADEARRSPWCE